MQEHDQILGFRVTVSNFAFVAVLVYGLHVRFEGVVETVVFDEVRVGGAGGVVIVRISNAVVVVTSEIVGDHCARCCFPSIVQF